MASYNRFKTKIKWKFVSFVYIILLKLYFPNVSFCIVKNKAELEEVYSLCWRIYGLEKKYFNTRTSKPNLFNDAYEKYSVVIGAYNKKKLIGATRIIFSSPLGFYATEDYNIDLPKDLDFSEIVEIDRCVVEKEYRKNSLISFGMLSGANAISRINGIKYWVLVIPEGISKSIFSKRFGIEHKPLYLMPLTEKQIKAREIIPNYYKTGNPVPYLIPLDNIKGFDIEIPGLGK